MEAELVTLTIDDIKVKAKKGIKVLDAALGAGIYIPHLCYLPEAEVPLASCRLCYVEIEGRGMVTACTELVAEGIVVHTHNPRIDRLRHTTMRLILANHPIDCSSCPRNRDCELQRIAAYLHIKLGNPSGSPSLKGDLGGFREMPLRDLPIDDSHSLFIYDPNKCVLCGKCVMICNERMGVGVLNFIFRGYNTRVGTFREIPWGEAGCISCGACVAACPVGALVPKNIKVLSFTTSPGCYDAPLHHHIHSPGDR